MHINNKCAWIEWFSVPNIVLELHTGLTRNAILKARNVLKQYGLIDFKPNGTKATSYKIMSTLIANSVQVGVQDSVQVGVQVGVQDSVQVGYTLNKQNKTKQNETDVEEEKEEATPATAKKEVVNFYLNNINSMPTEREMEILESYQQDLPADLLIYGMEKAVENKVRNLAYCKGIWKSWISKGITTLAEAKEETKENKPSNVIDWSGFMERHKEDG